MIKAVAHDTVKVKYIGRLSDGTVFDQSPEERPLHFILGKGEVIAGFDEAVIGMYQGETKTVTIPFQKAYGPSKPELIEVIDRKLLPEDLELEKGRQIEVTQQDDTRFYVSIVDFNDQTVTLDGNHPLAGKDLIFDITLNEVKKKPLE
ncbi:MAG: peptidylprolyl isomerase [Deltaproteobacteria bacterium]|jgi:peptidylprolyl isomerase|nr:peptidylprolyl isomerase [Deltaproteobacteria bacterium]MBW2503361.1 peptidylprolyl isomerase [Deltaproteobacteria bacterium]MBW2520589.1 peptidylprolyl isomerase [Deltaproteobacteria bacterium]